LAKVDEMGIRQWRGREAHATRTVRTGLDKLSLMELGGAQR
jgi:hypothetical protein